MFTPAHSTAEKTVQQLHTPVGDRVANNEAMLLGFLAEKSLSFSLAPSLLELVKEMSKDAKALSQTAMHRVSASYKMRLGVGKTLKENLIEDLRVKKFSLNIDKTTGNNNEKIVTVLVNYLRNKFVTEHLQSFSVENVNSDSIFEGIVKIIEGNNIPWHNLISVLFDSCNVKSGKKAGVEVKLREKCPHLLDIDGDSCHHTHNAAKQFCKPFNNHLESLFSDVHNDFKWSPDLRAALMDICEALHLQFTMPENYVSFRWLSVYNVAQDFSRMLDAFMVFYFSFLETSEKLEFLHLIVKIYKSCGVTEAGRKRIRKIQKTLAAKNMTEAGKQRKSRIANKLVLVSLQTKLNLHLFVSVLPLLQEYVKVFQSNAPLVRKLHDKQL